MSLGEKELSCGLLNSAIHKQGFGYAKQPGLTRTSALAARSSQNSAVVALGRCMSALPGVPTSPRPTLPGAACCS